MDNLWISCELCGRILVGVYALNFWSGEVNEVRAMFILRRTSAAKRFSV